MRKLPVLVGVTKATGYAWFKRWNSRGYEGLIFRILVEVDPLNLQKSRRKNYREMLKEKEWTTKEVQEVIEAEFGVIYSSWQVRRILKSFGMRYARPYRRITEGQMMQKTL